MNKQKSLSAGEKYRQIIANRQPEIIEITAPSGFIFKFKKPSKFALLFIDGELPQSAEAFEENQVQLAKKVFNIRDKVLLLSYEPKIVIGKAAGANEISTDDITDEDLSYLFKWVAAGGDEAAMKSMIPAELKQGVAAGALGGER
jgi:hypothetical protein